MTFDRINTLYEKSNFHDLLEQLAGMEKELKIATFSVEEQVKCVFFKQQALMWRGQYKESLAVVKQARKKKLFSERKIHQLALIVAEMYALHFLGRHEEAAKVRHEGETLLDSLPAEERVAGTYWVALFYNIKVHILRAIEEFTYDNAITILEQSVTLFESIGSPFDIARPLNNLGLSYTRKGELNRGLNYHQRALTLAESKENEYAVFIQLASIGAVYQQKGELDQALEYLQQCLPVFESLEVPYDLSVSFKFIAHVYREKGEYETAHKYLRKSLRIEGSLGNDFELSVTLFGLILVVLAQQNLGEAEIYLSFVSSLAIFQTLLSSDVVPSALCHLKQFINDFRLI